MKSIRRPFLIVLLAISMVFVSCVTSQQEAIKETITLPTLQSSVAVIDKYGNCTLALSEQELIDAGYAVGDWTTISIGDFTYEAPIGTAYSDVDKGNYLIRLNKGSVILAINYGNLTKTSGAEEGEPVSIDLLEKGGYLQEFELRHLVRTEERKDYASDAIFANFRSVQFGTIAPNRLYRSANPILGDARAPYVEALAKLVGIKTVINLADDQQSLYAHLDEAPFYKGLVESGSVIALDMGVTFTDPEFIAKLKTGLTFMAEHKGPYLIHCNEGKDRAGFVSALLSGLMGASVDEIVTDYMTSYQNYYGVEKGTERYAVISKIITNIFAELNGGKAVTDKTLKKVSENYLIKTVGLSSDQIKAIKDNLSDKSVKLEGSITFIF
ncbi:protein tyrosine/serine phosphatase [Sphaerochaeta pleomorpha str. Grapes]|uniref:Protein tyrosine/serine phosphatase n=1 Tax=Sphaerochaeta pleomorpha (strain ATCC BAA-1885 / DSM 22778 / Grapes) TaxID=158190 RepID=G8QRY8_SPHPG|nr:tyrosine-protein phosphatase [Sphaerochaeta pleomorpha]AEV29986.1 protein tyrosine/serine phosphatase [Sphaerochaeta pleomorpha str. Grapes]